MTFLYNPKFSVNYFEQTHHDNLFYYKTYQLAKTFPLKWYEFINKVVGNNQITYFKDTTMIINLIDLDLSLVKITFEVLKEYYKDNLFSKIIYKKEYIIVHFLSVKTKEVFEHINLWQAIYLYYIIKENYNDLNVYLRGIIRKNVNEYENVDLIIKDKNDLYLVSSTNPISEIYGVSKNIYLYNKRSRNVLIPLHNNHLIFSFDPNQFLTNFEYMRNTLKVQ